MRVESPQPSEMMPAMVEYVHRTITIQAMDGPLQIHLAARELF